MKGYDMSTNENDFAGHFHVGYNENHDLFEAYVHNPDRNTWVLREVSSSLEDLLQLCRQGGLTTFDGLNPKAVERIYQWLVVERPALEYVESMWQGSGNPPSSRGPIGFRTRVMED